LRPASDNAQFMQPMVVNRLPTPDVKVTQVLYGIFIQTYSLAKVLDIPNLHNLHGSFQNHVTILIFPCGI